MTTTNKLISMTIAEELLQKVDRAAHEDYCSRSDFVRQALLDALKRREKAVKNIKKGAISSLSDTELADMHGLLDKEKHRRAIALQLAEQTTRFRRPSAR